LKVTAAAETELVASYSTLTSFPTTKLAGAKVRVAASKVVGGVANASKAPLVPARSVTFHLIPEAGVLLRLKIRLSSHFSKLTRFAVSTF